MRLYEAVANALPMLGGRRLFGVMGDANMRVLATYSERADTAYVGAAHEAGAVAMADGYARLSGGVGFVSLTHGPGFTNGLTALTEAARARTPLLVLTGSTPPQRVHNQWLDLRAAAKLAGAGFRTVQQPGGVVEDLALAVRACSVMRRPIVVDIPAGMMGVEIEDVVPSCGFGPWRPPRSAPDEESLDAALGVIASADRPIVLAGRGVSLAGAASDAVALAEVLDAPLATTVMAMGLGTDYPLHLGIFGAESHSVAVEQISRADCVIVLGAGLNSYTTSNGDLLRGKAVVRCDADPGLVASSDPAWTSVLADAGIFARRAVETLRELGGARQARSAEALRGRLATFEPAADYVDAGTPTTVDLRSAMTVLDDLLPQERALVTDVGRFKTAPWRHLRCSPGAFTQSGHFSAIGLGLPMAIGAAFADPQRLTVGVVGDGGLMMSLSELATAVEHGLPLLLCVANDSAYGAEYLKLAEYGHDPAHCLRSWPSFAAVAQGFGARGEVITDCDSLKRLGSTLAEPSGPTVLDIRMDPTVNVRRYR